MKRVFFVILPNVHLLDLAGPLQVIATLAELGLAPVATHCVSPQPSVNAFQGVRVVDLQPLPSSLLEGDVLFMIGSKLTDPLNRSPEWLETVAWLGDVVARAPGSIRVCSVCTGSFPLAEAGLLDGRLSTTHHSFLGQFKRRFPRIHVTENRVLVRDGRFMTSAGVTSGIDLALALIEEFFGSAVALRVARENVVHFRRFSNDPQLSTALRYRSHGNQLIHDVQDRIGDNLAQPAICRELAAQVGVGERHLMRLFQAETGISIKQYQLELRMDLAERLIVESSLPLEDLVERCGFSSMQAFRANWNKRTRITPLHLRRQRQLVSA